MNKFWNLMNERTELCHKALQYRHKRLEGTLSDAAPILWQHGAFARLEKGEKIDELLHHGYSTISLGYAGLYECVKFMTGHSHTDNGIGEEFGLKVMQYLNDKCNQWKAEEDIDYSPYGSPIESTTYKFAKCLKKRFGDDVFIKLDGKDRNYITNSYHVPVFEEIDPFRKLKIESKFQKLSTGGAISYIEASDLTSNTEAVLEVIKFIYDNILYAEKSGGTYNSTEIICVTNSVQKKRIFFVFYPACNRRRRKRFNFGLRNHGDNTLMMDASAKFFQFR